MFTSLRSRLWLSYALLITTALFITAVVIIIYIVRSPLVHRQALSNLNAVSAVILDNTDVNLRDLPRDALQSIAERYDSVFDVRVLFITTGREVIADSRLYSQAAFPASAVRFLRTTPIFKDKNGQSWLVTVGKIKDGLWLVLGTPRPNTPLLLLLRDELVLPFLVAGIIALILSLLVAYSLARWIAGPLQGMLSAARSVPTQQTGLLPLKGPREVKELTGAFNEMNNRVQASQKSQREFVANVSHELKTPLTSIQGFAQAILDRTAGDEAKRQQAARIIYDEAGRMHRMVLDLLDLARLDAGTLDLQRAQVDLLALINDTVEKFTTQARQAGVTLRVDTEALPPITGDGDRLAQVFTNLVDNALKFTPPGGQISLRASPSDDFVAISISDSGAGIPTEAIPHIFERFYQADPSRKGGERHGSGLGLAIAREIVQAYGGEISVESEPGRGSTFRVRLPRTVSGATTVLSKRRK